MTNPTNPWTNNAGQATPAYGVEPATSAGLHSQGLSPNEILAYLATHLDDLEDQVNGYFVEQKRADDLRGLLRDMKTQINSLNPHSENMNEVQYGAQAVVDNVNATLDSIEAIDPHLADQLRQTLSQEGFILCDGSDQTLGDDAYLPAEVEASVEYLDGEISNLNSTSQLNMIYLQSLVRAHETAVSLGTNLVESAGRTTQKIVDRIGG